MGFFDDDDDYWFDRPQNYMSARKAGKIANDPSKHYPNKDEAAVLRKIKSDTGLSEEEIRSIKKYRVMLSEAQKRGEKPKRHPVEVFWQRLIKEACQETGLVPQHPDTLAALEIIIERYYGRVWRRPMHDRLSAKRAVHDFAKKKKEKV